MNGVEDHVVDALLEAVEGSYPRLSHRYYQIKAKWLGKDRLSEWDRNAPLPGDADRAVPHQHVCAQAEGGLEVSAQSFHQFAAGLLRGWLPPRYRFGKLMDNHA